MVGLEEFIKRFTLAQQVDNKLRQELKLQWTGWSAKRRVEKTPLGRKLATRKT